MDGHESQIYICVSSPPYEYPQRSDRNELIERDCTGGGGGVTSSPDFRLVFTNWIPPILHRFFDSILFDYKSIWIVIARPNLD